MAIKTELIKLSQLENNEGQVFGVFKNPRDLDNAGFDYCLKSIKAFPEMLDVRTLVVIPNKDKYVVIGGNQRLRALRELGYVEAPCAIVKDWKVDKINEFIVKDNLAYGSWNWDMLANEWEAELLADWGLPLPLKLETIEPIVEGEIPEIPEEPKTKLGDLWLLGKHRLMCGDSTLIDNVETLMNGKKADMVFTDPPYNVAVVGGCKNPLDKTFQSGKTILNDKMGDKEFYQFLFDFYSNARLVSNDECAIYIAHSDSEGINFRTAMVNAGWLMKQCIIWMKSSFVFGRQDYHWQHEPILYGWNSAGKHNFYGQKNQSTIWNFDRPVGNSDKLHPTMKPIELVEKAIMNSSKPNDIILDLFGGAGSTLLACENTNRISYNMELDPKYCDVIINRWQNFTKQSAILESTKQPFNEI